jgi:hypothetical protein
MLLDGRHHRLDFGRGGDDVVVLDEVDSPLGQQFDDAVVVGLGAGLGEFGLAGIFI